MICVVVIVRFCSVFFVCDGDHLYLHVLTHSFPTRRSADLTPANSPAPHSPSGHGSPSSGCRATPPNSTTSNAPGATSNATTSPTTPSQTQKIGRAHV